MQRNIRQCFLTPSPSPTPPGRNILLSFKLDLYAQCNFFTIYVFGYLSIYINIFGNYSHDIKNSIFSNVLPYVEIRIIVLISTFFNKYFFFLSPLLASYNICILILQEMEVRLLFSSCYAPTQLRQVSNESNYRYKDDGQFVFSVFSNLLH